MSNTSPTSGFWNYVAECLRLLYWSYFKPFTFERWLRDIHPELKPTDNPFAKLFEFRTNPYLRRYASQVWWLSALVPSILVVVVGTIYTLVSNEKFNWFRSCLFFLGWLISLLAVLVVAEIYTLVSSKTFRRVCACLLIFLSIPIVIIQFGSHKQLEIWLSQSICIVWPLILGVVLGVGVNVTIGVVAGIVIGIAGDFLIALIVETGQRSEVAESVAARGGSEAVVVASVIVCVTCGVIGGLLMTEKIPEQNKINVPQLLGGVVGGILIGAIVALSAIVIGPVNFSFEPARKALVIVLGEQRYLKEFLELIILVLILISLRSYLWLLELLWMLILFFLFRFVKQINYLQYLPHRFDENIILPLPFLYRIIVETYLDNPVATRETIDYLISSTNQQKVAAKGIYEIAKHSLNRCQRLGDIADISYQLTWILSLPPKELGTVLPQFLDISQGVRASQEATSLYRQYELLKSPIRALHELKNNLAFKKNASLATKFGSIAERWLTILQTAQRTLEDTTRQSQEIRQVYIAGNSLDPETAKNRFKGRIDIFREIESLALSEQPPVLLLYGGRRTGKTSALKYLPHRIQANIVPLLVDIQGAAAATTLKGLAENLAQQIIEAARRLPRRVYLPNPDANKLAEDPFPALQTWLAEIERNNSGKQFLLCLDEYERLGEVVKATNSRAPLNFIRNLVQHQQKWILLFSGSQELSELDDYWSDYLINTRALRMTYLHESEARDLIQQPVENFGDIYEPTAVDAIIQVTRCQPYLVQLVCYEVVELLNRDIRRNRREADTVKATAQDVKEVIPVVLERGDQYFRELWKSLTDSDQNLLQRLIHGETPTQQDKGVIRKLTRKEILTQEGNAFQVPLVRKYIEQLLEEE